MIFTPVSELKDKASQNFFREQIRVYIRLVEVYCEKHQLEFVADDVNCNIEEFIKIGVISGVADVTELRKLLSDDFSLSNEQIMHLEELYNNNKKQAEDYVNRFCEKER